MYDSFCEYFKLDKINVKPNQNLTEISSSETRPCLKAIKYPYENIKTMFAQTSFKLQT
jgi:hypothetical protein